MNENKKELTKFILDNKLHITHRKILNNIFRSTLLDDASFQNAINQLDTFNDTYGIDLSKRCSQLNHNFRTRANRLFKRIEKMVLNSGRCYFLTLTFDNDTLERTNELTRRRYVARALKEHCIDYVANQDYGEKGGREHYHAVVTIDDIDTFKWAYGFKKCELVRNTEDDYKRVSKYVSKLTNHALKETSNSTHLIYSR